MKKEDEIKRELAAAIENYENFKKEGKKEEARQALERVQALTGELNEVTTCWRRPARRQRRKT